MFRVAGPRPEVIRPFRAAPDAVPSWLAFHAHRLAVGLFVQGRPLDDCLAEVGSGGVLGDRAGSADPTAPISLAETTVEPDPGRQAITLIAPDGTRRTAQRRGRYGCVVLPAGQSVLDLPGQTSRPHGRALPPDPASPWPEGSGRHRSGADPARLDALAARITADGLGRAFVVIHDGRLIAQSYAPGFDHATPHPGWSMTKSLVGALAGAAVQRGWLRLDRPVPIPEWHRDPADPRGLITLDDLLRMSSGLDCPGGLTPWAAGDRHFRVYAGLPDVHRYVTGLPARTRPGARCAYQNCDPMAAAIACQHAAAGSGTHPADLPWELLLDPVGMNSMVLHADPAGHFILAGYSTATALDWARFGQLYLDDGVWRGCRLLPEGWLRYAMTPAPADTEPVYGGALLWLGRRVLGERPFGGAPSGMRLPPCALAAGHYGQRVLIIPSLRLVLVRMGHGVDDDLLVTVTEEIIEELPR
jgi:CubicO group peptidase (beta-lactamase class C family)